MGSSLISISVAVIQNRQKSSDNNNSDEDECTINEDLLLETPTTVVRRADRNFVSSNVSTKSAKIGKIAKFRERSKDDPQPAVFSPSPLVSHCNFLSMCDIFFSLINETILNISTPCCHCTNVCTQYFSFTGSEL
jgi:hypothetical protein